jgi:glucan-binding YG repeat protein
VITIPDLREFEIEVETEELEGSIEVEIETEESETEEEAEREEEETEESETESQGESAQFDARLGVAIDTVSALVEIAPNEEAETGLQNALDQLREVQNQTDTASLPEEGPGGPERADEAENETEEEESENESSEDSGQQGPPENRGPSGDRGPSRNSNRPGFVNQMLGGIFG